MTEVSDDRLIVAMGGGGFQFPPDNGRLDAFLLALARDRSGHDRPRICYIPTACADSNATLTDFYAAFSGRAEASHLALFNRTVHDINEFLLAQDVVLIAGGNTPTCWRSGDSTGSTVRCWLPGRPALS